MSAAPSPVRIRPGDRVRYVNSRGLPGLELIVRELLERDDGPPLLARAALPTAPEAPGCILPIDRLEPLESAP